MLRKLVSWNETPPQGRTQIPMQGVSLLRSKNYLVMLAHRLAPLEASDLPVLSAEDLIMDLREAAELLETEASSEQAAPPRCLIVLAPSPFLPRT